jgi:hypothetical protein
MSIEPEQYRPADVCRMLQYSAETIRKLVIAGILIKRGRGSSARISAASVNAC